MNKDSNFFISFKLHIQSFSDHCMRRAIYKQYKQRMLINFIIYIIILFINILCLRLLYLLTFSALTFQKALISNYSQ